MIHTGICPHCKKRIADVNVQDVDMKYDLMVQWRGYSYQCPSCKSVLGVQMNPLTLNHNLKKDILEELKKILT
jgi:uncharacterized protein YlaI